MPDSELILWAQNALKMKGFKALVSTTPIVKTPWSNVLELNTGNEVFYLKQTPADLFIEAKIIKLLRTLGLKTIPQILAENKRKHCFLMRQCGDLTLRDYFEGNLQLDVFKQAIANYKKLQHLTIKFVDKFIAMGVPDWRLVKFPTLYNQLIDDTEFLDNNNVTFEQQRQLHQYRDKVKNLCAELSAFGVTETFNHSDFHDNNILYNQTNQTTAIIDFAEAAINHPLFSLYGCMESVKSRYNFTDQCNEYILLKKFAYDGFFNGRHTLDRAIEVVRLLFPVYLLLNLKRFLDAIDMPFNINDPLSIRQHEKIKKGFMWFLKNMDAASLK